MSKISFLPSLFLFKWDEGVSSCITKLVVLSHRNNKNVSEIKNFLMRLKKLIRYTNGGGGRKTRVGVT